MRTLPDGFNGAVMAVESIEDAAVLLHGPGGCRIRHMIHSTATFPRVAPGSPEDYYGIYYYGYPRVPATYLDEYDFINGAFYKMSEALPVVAAKEPSIIVVINSPGAALIGDNHEKAIRDSGLEGRAIYMDESLVSMPMTECYGHMLRAVMEHLSPERRDVVPGTVNLLGLSLFDKDWAAGREELCAIVESMGLKVVSTPGAGTSVQDLKDSVSAEMNVVVCPEMCAGLLEYYESLGIPTVRSPAGAPVGFSAVREWAKAVAVAAGKDPGPALEKVRSAERKVYDKLMGMKYNALRMRGMSFSIAGTASVVRPLAEWLYSYLSMVPVAVAVDPGADEREVSMLRSFLDERDLSDSFGKEPLEGSEAVLCEGVTALTMAEASGCIGIPIGHSCTGMDDIIPRPIYGVQGALYILDEMMHGVRGSRGRVPERLGPSVRRPSDLPGLQKVEVQSEESRPERYQDRQGDPGELQVVGEGGCPYGLAGMRQREAVQHRLEHGVQGRHREERAAEERHGQYDQAVQGRHALVRLGQKGGGHPQQGERDAGDDDAQHHQRGEGQVGGQEQPQRIDQEAANEAPGQPEHAFAYDDGRQAQGAHHHLVEALVIQPLHVHPGRGRAEGRRERRQGGYPGDDERHVGHPDVRLPGPEPVSERYEVQQRAHDAHHQDVPEVVLHEHHVAPCDVVGVHQKVAHVCAPTLFPVSSTNTSSRLVSLIVTLPLRDAAKALASSLLLKYL